MLIGEAKILINNAINLYKQGDYSSAKYVCLGVLSEFSEYDEALHLMALLAQANNEYEVAVDYYENSLERTPEDSKIHSNYGNLLKKSGMKLQAENHYMKALSLSPCDAETYYNLGLLNHEDGNLETALKFYQKALLLKPQFPLALCNLALVHQQRKDYDQSEKCLGKVLSNSFNSHNAMLNLGLTLKLKGEYREAEKLYKEAIEAKPDFVKAYSNLAVLYHCMGELKKAEKYHEKAITLDHDFADSHWNYAITLLLTGDYLRGWKEYEWRWEAESFKETRRFPNASHWDGRQLSGKKLFVYAEQGFGDTIQFIRYMPLLANYGGEVVLEVQPALNKLLQNIPGFETIISKGEAIPLDFDYCLPLLSLPFVFRTTLDTIPKSHIKNTDAYIVPDQSVIHNWREKVSSEKMKVGLCWTGNPRNTYNSVRTCPFELLLPLLDIPNISFYDLQKDKTDLKYQDIGREHPDYYDLTQDLTDFQDTAGLISALDIIITVDTSIAHLSAAMGKPTWVMVANPPDWRYGIDKMDNLWYPTMKLFRQKSPKNWKDVIDEIKLELSGVANC